MPATRPSQLQSFQSFGELSRFLREGVADEDSRQLRDSLGSLADRIDELFGFEATVNKIITKRDLRNSGLKEVDFIPNATA